MLEQPVNQKRGVAARDAPRRYDNRGRARQAAHSRRRVLEAAHDLLVARGYAATTVADVAASAGVSVETVYKRFGSKAALAKAVYDVRLAGDDDPEPIAERGDIRAVVEEPDPRRKLARYAAMAAGMSERAGPLVAVLLPARGADQDLEDFARTIDAERLVGAGHVVEHLAETGGLRPGLDLARARDVLWALVSPELYILLVVRRGWTVQEYRDWLTHSMIDTLI